MRNHWVQWLSDQNRLKKLLKTCVTIILFDQWFTTIENHCKILNTIVQRHKPFHRSQKFTIVGVHFSAPRDLNCLQHSTILYWYYQKCIIGERCLHLISNRFKLTKTREIWNKTIAMSDVVLFGDKNSQKLIIKGHHL